MVAIKLRTVSFSGAGFIHDAGPNGLAAMVRGIAQDLARTKIEVASVPNLTDNSTGTKAATIAALVIPTAAFDGQTSGAAPGAAFNTAIGLFEDVGQVLIRSFNNVRVRLGLPLLVAASGSEATADTIPAMTKTLTSTNGATAIDFTTGVAKMKEARVNLATLVHGFNEIMEALGETKFAGVGGGFADAAVPQTLTAITDATSGTGTPAGKTSIDDTVMDTFLTALANDIASLAAEWNNKMFQAALTDLTDSSGGTAEDPLATAGVAFPLFQDGGTDSAPKAGWDAEIPKIDNNFADLALRANLLLERFDISPLIDSTTGTANTTLEVIDDTLTAVDGTGANSLENVTANATKVNVDNNVSTLMVEVNRLAPLFGVPTRTDNFGGTVSTTKTLVLTGTSGAGVDNGAAATGCADAAVDAWLDRVTDALATMAAMLNAMTGTLGDTMPTKELKVVAAL